MTTAYIGLGSNLDDPPGQLRTALTELDALPQSRLLRASALYRSTPMGPAGQPDYINAVAALETALSAHALLQQLQRLETAHRRVRAERWGPRTLDLDLLLYGDQRIDSRALTIPHPGLAERNFVLFPLYEIAPGLVLPDNRGIAALVANSPREGLQRLTEREVNP